MSISTTPGSTRSWPRPADRAVPVLLLLAGALFVAVLASASVGAYPIPLRTLWGGLLSGVLPERDATVLYQVRLPRIAAAMLTGAALAAAGATYQGLFRNPLVSPDVLGVSTGAGLGAVLGIFLGLPVLAIQLMGFVAGLATVALVWAIAAAVRGQDAVLVLVLTGVVVGALAGAGISLLKVLADPYDQLPAMTFWLLGSLAAITLQDSLAAAPLVAAAMVPLVLLRWRINLMALGDEEALALGVDAPRLRRLLVVAATLMTSAVVAVAGVVGWVGLVVPHLARLMVGPDFRLLLPASALLGAAYLLAVDTLARTLTAVEIPLGILTALLGAPFFLWLLATGRRAWR
ncbi:MAG TPA: iron ABC transporter permease [Geminicoccaceae bacterium]|nr:iron ABC transporter permease [Geminicoccus sp.]HMU52518.1 iron ABC transporter permease [Geminicoccaceae bacterium]